MARALTSVFVAVFLVLMAETLARAEQLLVLVNAPPLFVDAVEKALAPWQIQVQTVTSDVSLSESMPGARKSASLIAEQEASSTVVWLTRNAEGQAIWLYDAKDDRVVVRELLVAQPLDEAGAASAALSVKALLMHSHSAPESERFGATTAEVVPVTVPAQADPHWAAEGLLAIRQGFGGDAFAEGRMGLGLLYRFEHFELGARLSFGSGDAIANPELAGRFSQDELALRGRYPIALGAYTLGASVQAGLRRSSLQGRLGAGGAVDEVRINPSAGIGLDVSRDFTSLRLGVELSSTYMLRSQRYLVAGESVQDLSETDMILGAYAAFWLP